MKKLNEFIKDILITKLFNKIMIYCKMFCKKSMKAFKKIELHKKNEITFFLYLLMQDFKNYIKFSHFFYKKNSSFSFISYYLKKFYIFYNRFSLKIYYLTSLKYF